VLVKRKRLVLGKSKGEGKLLGRRRIKKKLKIYLDIFENLDRLRD
jgi:hypothetical protein